MGNKDMFIVTIYKGEETTMILAKKGDRIKLLGNRYITTGNEVPEELREIIRMDPVTADNKYKVKMIKQDMKKKNK